MHARAGTRRKAARRAATAIFIVTAGALVLVQAPAASPPQPASGSGQVLTTTFTDVRSADGNVIFEAVQTGTISGTFTGTFAEQVRVVQHPSGRATFHASATLSGTADGCGAGTIPIRLEGRGGPTLFEGRFVTTDQADNTAGIHANLTFVQVGAGAGSTFTYSGTFHCG